MKPTHLSLTDAALRLGASYWATRDLLLRGTLAGGRDAKGRYFVENASVGRLLRERSRQRSAAEPATASVKQPSRAVTAPAA